MGRRGLVRRVGSGLVVSLVATTLVISLSSGVASAGERVDEYVEAATLTGFGACGTGNAAATNPEDAPLLPDGGLLTNKVGSAGSNPGYGLITVPSDGPANAAVRFRVGVNGPGALGIALGKVGGSGFTATQSHTFSLSPAQYDHGAVNSEINFTGLNSGIYQVKVTPAQDQPWSLIPKINGGTSGSAIEVDTGCQVPEASCPVCDHAREGADDPLGFAGDPIDTSTGGFIESARDISLPSLGDFGFGMSRTYWSRAVDVTWPAGKNWTPLGPGWASVLSMRVWEDATVPGIYTVVQESGGQARFVAASGSNLLANGQLVSTGDVTATLEKDTPSTGKFTFQRSGGLTFVFGTNGELESVTDRYGYKTVFDAAPASGTNGTQVIHDYSSQNPALGNNPSQPHRKLTVTWTNDRVASVATTIPTPSGDIAGPRVDYTYTNDTARNLEHVRVSDTSNTGGDIADYEWLYGYDNDDHITVMRDPEHAAFTDGSRDYVNHYDGSNRVVSQRDPEGNYTYINYGFYADNNKNLNGVSITSGVSGPEELLGNGSVDFHTVHLKPLGNGIIRRTDYYNRRDETTKFYQRVLVRYGQNGQPRTTDPTKFDPYEPDEVTADSEVFRVDYDTPSPDKLDAKSGKQRGVKAMVVSEAVNSLSSYQALTEDVFDERGRVTSRTTHVDASPSNDRTTTISYDPADLVLDRPISVTDAMGIKTTIDYDANGDVSETCTPLLQNGNPSGNAGGGVDCDTSATDDQRTAITYQPAGTVPAWWRPGMATKVTDPNGKDWLAEYDAQTGLPTRTDNPEGGVSRFSYDAVGRQTLVIPPKGSGSANDASNPFAWRYETNLYGDVTEATDPLGAVTSVQLDRARRTVEVTYPAVQDGAARTSSFEYDGLGNPTRTERANGVVLESSFYPGGLLMSQTQDGATTTYAYDSRGRVTQVEQPGGDCTTGVLCDTYGYNHLNQIERHTQPGGDCTNGSTGTNCIRYSYDRAGGVKTVTYSNANEGNVNVTGVTYDKNGRRTGLTRNQTDGSSSWAWDSLGRLRSSTVEQTGTVAYRWDLNDNLTKIAYPGGNCDTNPASRCVTRGYDDASRWESVTDWNGKRVDFAPDANGNYDDMVFHTNPASPTTAQFTDVFSFDNADQLVGIDYKKNTTSYASLAYERFGSGELKSMTATDLAGPAAEHYGYDKASRLCWVAPTASTNACGSAPGSSGAYGYDSADNLVAQPDGTTQVFNPLNQLCYSVASGTSPSSTPVDASCTLPGDVDPDLATSYTYDERGNRTTKTPPTDADLASTYSYNQSDQLVTAAVPARDGNDGDYTPISPAQRFLDTAASSQTIAAGGTIEVTVVGVGGIPASDVSAVNLNMIVSTSTAAGALQVYPSDLSSPPGTSNLNFPGGQVIGNTVVIKPGPDGKVKIKSSSTAPVNIVLDSHGWWSTPTGDVGGTFTPTTPARIVDTRNGTGTTQAQIAAGGTLTVAVTNTGSIPATGVDTVTLNVTAVNATSTGYYGIYSADQSTWTGNQSVDASGPRATLAIVKVGQNGSNAGKVKIYNYNANPIDIVIDSFGWTSIGENPDGSAFTPITPFRVFDTATGTGTTQTPMTGDTKRTTVQLPFSGFSAVSVTVTALNPQSQGFISLQQGDSNVTAANVTTSNLNYETGETLSNSAIVKSTSAGTIDVINIVGTTDVTIDINGVYGKATANWTYQYGPDGLRTVKTGPSNQTGVSGTTTYTWGATGGLPELLQEAHPGDVGPTTNYIYGPGGLPIAQIVDDHNAATDDAAATIWYHHDQLGSSRILTNNNGDTLTKLAYDAYGNITTNTNLWYLPRLGYTGQYHDHETGLVYLRARYYEPSSGQFITRDPISVLTRDPYSYVESDPLNWVDPLGLDEEDVAPITQGKPERFPDDPATDDEGENADEDELDCDRPDLAAAARRKGGGNTQGKPPKGGNHTKNARPSTSNKHQKADARRQADQRRSSNPNKRRPQDRFEYRQVDPDGASRVVIAIVIGCVFFCIPTPWPVL